MTLRPFFYKLLFPISKKKSLRQKKITLTLPDRCWSTTCEVNFQKCYQRWIMTEKNHSLIKWKLVVSYGNIISLPHDFVNSNLKGWSNEEKWIAYARWRMQTPPTHLMRKLMNGQRAFYVPVHSDGIESLGWLFFSRFHHRSFVRGWTASTFYFPSSFPSWTSS